MRNLDGVGFPSYGFLTSSPTLNGLDQVPSSGTTTAAAAAAESYFTDLGTASTTNHVIAALAARQSGDSLLTVGAPTLLTDHHQYLSQRGLQEASVTATAAGNVLPLSAGHTVDYGT